MSSRETTPAGAPSFLRRISRAKRGHPEGRPGLWVIVAAWGPCGYAPIAPGTAGTLGAIPVFWLMRNFPLPLYLVTLLGLFAVGVYAAGRAGAYWREADASPIVIDEVVGYLVTVALVRWSWPSAIVCFLLFRLMDVVKPWPASAFDRMKNGFGVVMDDVAAGAYAYLAFELLRFGLGFIAGCAGSTHWWCPEVYP